MGNLQNRNQNKINWNWICKT